MCSRRVDGLLDELPWGREGVRSVEVHRSLSVARVSPSHNVLHTLWLQTASVGQEPGVAAPGLRLGVPRGAGVAPSVPRPSLGRATPRLARWLSGGSRVL